MDDLLKAFSQLGFPAAVAVYLLVRFEQRLSELTAAIQKVALVCERIEAREGRDAA